MPDFDDLRPSLHNLVDRLLDVLDRPTEQGKTPLELFLDEKTYHVPGYAVPLDQFYAAMVDWCKNVGIVPPSKIDAAHSLPERYPVAYHSGNVKKIGNVALSADTVAINPTPYFASAGHLRRAVPSKSA